MTIEQSIGRVRASPTSGRTKAILRRLVIGPVGGETYSLFGATDSTSGYFLCVSDAADRIVDKGVDAEVVLRRVQGWRQNRGKLRRAASGRTEDPVMGEALELLRNSLGEYTREVTVHLRGLPLRSRWDRTLSMIEEQYHLAMLEIELANRAYLSRFRRSTLRLAFLPHCLRDMSRKCKSAPDHHDSVCMGCSARCWINGISSLLRDYSVLPYIWLRSDLGALFRSIRKEGVDVAVMGIACVPELARGIALCMRHQVPVIGLPLNANRCARWTGEFKANSVDLDQLEALLGR
jgi:hypothetical protein